MSTYQPNFKDPRILRRIQKVLTWAEPRLQWHLAEFVDSSELTKIFGNQSSNNLSIWLRNIILIREDAWIVGDQSYAYLINRDGYRHLFDIFSANAVLHKSENLAT